MCSNMDMCSGPLKDKQTLVLLYLLLFLPLVIIHGFE